jgi:cystathionine gamma-synthase
MKDKNFAAASLAAQAMGWIDPVTKAVVPPIHMASTYQRDEDNGFRSGRIYARADNPTFDQVEATLAALEGGPKGVVFSSGMSAASACFLALAPGDHVVAPKVMYWSLRNWLAGFAMQWGLKVEFVDADKLDAIAAAVKPGVTKLVWLETPANPTWAVTDIAGAAEIAHKAGAMLAVDSTVATPVLTRPIELGADIVMHSATKYLNGHSDVIAGALCFARDDALCARARHIRHKHGLILHPFEAFRLVPQRTQNGRNQTRQSRLQNVIRGPAFQHLDNDLFSERAGHEDEGNIRILLLGHGQGAKAVVSGESVVEQNNIRSGLLQGLEKHRFGINSFERKRQSSFAQSESD